MASPSRPYATPSSIPIRSHASQPYNSLPLQARTRSMSRLSLTAIANGPTNNIAHLSKSSSRMSLSKRTNAEGIRRPLQNVKVNEEHMVNGKRKAVHLDGRATKVRKQVDNESPIILRPPTPPRPHTPLHTNGVKPLSTPQRSLTSAQSYQTPQKTLGSNQPVLVPTPARELLRRRVEDEDEGEVTTTPKDSPPGHMIPRPPTPPRKHIDQHNPKPTTPLRIINPNNSIASPIPRLSFSTPHRVLEGSGTSPLKARPFLPTPVSKGVGSSNEESSTLTDCTSAVEQSLLPGPTPAEPSSAPQYDIAAELSSVEAAIGGDDSHNDASQPIKTTSASDEMAQQSADLVQSIEPQSNEDIEMAFEPIQSSSTQLQPPTVSKSSSTRTTSIMGAPTRIPAPMTISRPSLPTPRSTTPPVHSTLKKPTPSMSSLSKLSRRPSTKSNEGLKAYGFTSTIVDKVQPQSISSDLTTTTAGSTIRKKPSYPSSLGSGPLAKPVSRMVSNPILPPRATSNPFPSSSMDVDNTPNQSPRSVSDPVPSIKPAEPQPNPLSLSMSSRRRDGFSSETSKSLMNLTDALEKLKVKRIESISTDTNRPRPSTSRLSISAADRSINLNVGDTSITSTSVHRSSLSSSTTYRPRQSLTSVYRDTTFSANADPDSLEHSTAKEKDGSIAALMSSTSGGFLKGVVAFVDVYTAEGEDASPLFTEMLRSCGAKVLSRLTESVTHVIYKSGRPTTLTWYRKQEDPQPHIVGIGWVTGSKKAGKRLLEESYVINVAEEDVFQKRRKSMEPKQLALRASVGPGTDLGGSKSGLLAVPETLSVSQARKKSLLYAPKIGSPLKKAYVHRESDSDDD